MNTTERVPISVVVPTYNGARFLRRTLGSVLAQTVQPRELIVVDDGSADGSAEIALEMGASVIRQENGGICAARNAGIVRATSPYVALLDHDDEWLPTKLETQFRAAMRFPDAVLIATDCKKVTVDGHVIDESFAMRPEVQYELLRVDALEADFALHIDAAEELARTGWFLMPSASLLKRSALLETGMFDIRTPRAEDGCCFLRVLMKGPLVFVRQPLTLWIIHGSNSHGDDLAMLKGLLALDKLMQLEPSTFPESFRRRLLEERPDRLLDTARIEIERGLRVSALKRLFHAARAGRARRSLALAALTCMPTSLQEKLIAFRRKKG